MQVVCIKTVSVMLGVSYSTAGRKIRQCKEALGKLPHQYLTVEEFMRYYGLVNN